MHDELRRAYAVLGLKPDVPLPNVKRQFKALVRRWHPDRFASDPQGATQANDQLRVLNHAYRTIVAAAMPSRGAGARQAPSGAPYSTERLTRDEIDALIAALQAHRRPRPFREQIWDDPWNRAGSILVAEIAMIERVWTMSSHPWRRFALAGIRPIPAGLPAVAAIIGTLLWTTPLVLAIWYGNRTARVVAWVLLVLFTLVLPFFVSAGPPLG